MENQNNRVSERNQEHTHTEHHGAHSGFRKGMSDYNDGNLNSHYLGNDDQKSQDVDDSEFDGSVANGNDMEVASDEEDYGKYHSGL